MDLLALALNRDWKEVGSMLTSKGLLGFGKKKKSPIGFERVIRLLGQERYRAPDFVSSLHHANVANAMVCLAWVCGCVQVLGQYLAELDDPEVRYQLAMEVGMYDIALECLKVLRDRERVKTFINFVPINKHYEFRAKVDSLLANSVSAPPPPNTHTHNALWCFVPLANQVEMTPNFWNHLLIFTAN